MKFNHYLIKATAIASLACLPFSQSALLIPLLRKEFI